jgi:hypothetical protein
MSDNIKTFLKVDVLKRSGIDITSENLAKLEKIKLVEIETLFNTKKDEFLAHNKQLNVLDLLLLTTTLLHQQLTNILANAGLPSDDPMRIQLQPLNNELVKILPLMINESVFFNVLNSLRETKKPDEAELN